ncbi:MAG: hypothetical protein DME87_08975 [Verrucomicrobia bacterium]|nr:MAG: hypothetical protein DME87_08975 [Verrucomicrobiota bacterium]
MHLPAPVDGLVPLVEFSFGTPLNRGQEGHSGSDVGFIAQLHFYLDDLFPHSIGRPLFGGNK